MTNKMILLCLTMTMACLGSDEHRNPLDEWKNFALVSKKLDQTCAKEFYERAIAAGQQEDAHAIAKDSFGENWRVAILQQPDRANSAHLIDAYHNSDWANREKSFLRKLVKNHPTMKGWLKEAGKIVPKEIDFGTRASHKGEICSLYADEIERLQLVCAQKYYRQMLEDGCIVEAQAIAEDSFGKNWETAIEQKIERHNPSMQNDSPLMRSLVWCEAKNQFIDRMIKKGPSFGTWFLRFKLDDCGIDSEIEEDFVEDSFDAESDERELVEQQEFICKVFKKIAKRTAGSVAASLNLSREEKRVLENGIWFLFKDNSGSILNEQRYFRDQDFANLLNSLSIVEQVRIPEEQMNLVQAQLNQVLNSLEDDSSSDEYSGSSDFE